MWGERRQGAAPAPSKRARSQPSPAVPSRRAALPHAHASTLAHLDAVHLFARVVDQRASKLGALRVAQPHRVLHGRAWRSRGGARCVRLARGRRRGTAAERAAAPAHRGSASLISFKLSIKHVAVHLHTRSLAHPLACTPAHLHTRLLAPPARLHHPLTCASKSPTTLTMPAEKRLFLRSCTAASAPPSSHTSPRTGTDRIQRLRPLRRRQGEAARAWDAWRAGMLLPCRAAAEAHAPHAAPRQHSSRAPRQHSTAQRT